MTRSRLLVAALGVAFTAVVMVVTAVPLSPQNPLGECALTFDDPAALGAISDQAANTFAPGYRMSCAPHFLNVETVTYQHFHLGFENTTLGECFAEANGIFGFGKYVNGQCVAADWDHEPRYLLSHVQEHWIKMWMEDGSSHQPRAFDLRRIHVGAGHPIQLWFRTQDGTWWFWNELNDAKNWKVEKWAKDVVEVRIRGTNTGLGSYVIRNAYVRK